MKRKYCSPKTETVCVERLVLLAASGSGIKVNTDGDSDGSEFTDGGETKDDTEYNPW